jgi:hypothetical protein
MTLIRRQLLHRDPNLLRNTKRSHTPDDPVKMEDKEKEVMPWKINPSDGHGWGWAIQRLLARTKSPI